MLWTMVLPRPPVLAWLLGGLIVLGALGHSIAHATLLAFTDQTTFQTALTSHGFTNQHALNFDPPTATAGDILLSGATLGGITFTYDFGGVAIQIGEVTDPMAFDTTSPPHFLGTDDANVFQDGDDFAMAFAPVHALGLFFMSGEMPDPMCATAGFRICNGDITLHVGNATAALAVSTSAPRLQDGAYVYFLGIVDPIATFTTASITTHGGGGAFLYTVDDIVTATSTPTAIPEPSTLGLLGIGVGGLIALRRRIG